MNYYTYYLSISVFITFWKTLVSLTVDLCFIGLSLSSLHVGIEGWLLLAALDFVTRGRGVTSCHLRRVSRVSCHLRRITRILCHLRVSLSWRPGVWRRQVRVGLRLGRCWSLKIHRMSFRDNSIPLTMAHLVLHGVLARPVLLCGILTRAGVVRLHSGLGRH